jgi:hypothetical protein
MKTQWHGLARAMARALGLSSALMLSGISSATDFSVPHTFSAGQRAQASEVNQNFSAAAAAINGNAAALAAALQQLAALEELIATLQATISAANFGGVPVYSQGQFIGTLLDYGDAARLLSARGYVFHATFNEFDPQHWMSDEEWLRPQETIYFADANCVGDAYLAREPDLPSFSWEVDQGLVFRPHGPVGEVPVYYVPRAANGELQSYNSVLRYTACVLEAGEQVLWQALPNDEDVTGVPDAPYAKPFSLGLP